MTDDDATPQQSRDRVDRSLSSTMTLWAPVAAGVIRAAAGVLAFSASLLTLPIHFATPFLSGVGLLMLVGGCVSVIKSCRDEPRLRRFAQVFPLVCAGLVVVTSVIVAVWGAGAFAPDLGGVAPRAAPIEDGAIRFEPG
ncbi:MAG: hypothetical protein Q8O67_13700 [Deltaproteobacteria bacterium]|nr:hypothetical protein [Deltaproteobacteria bacterium]